MLLPIFLLLLALIGTVRTKDQQCTSQRMSSLKFGVTSYTNDTGHRLVKATLLYDTQGPLPVSLAVDQWTGLCGDTKTLNLDVDVTVPPDVTTESQPDTTVPRPELVSPTTPKPPSTTGFTIVDGVGIYKSFNSVTVPPNVTTDTTVPRRELPSPTTPKPPCTTSTATGYTIVDGVGVYKPFNLLVDWKEAKKTCRTESAFLAMPNTQEEVKALFALVIKAQFKWPTWTDIIKYGDEWSIDTVDSKMWAKGEPSGDGRCAELTAIGLNDVPCESLRPFICEKQLD